MAIEFNLKPEDIDALVRESIMKSGFGSAVEKALQTALTSGYKNPIDAELRKIVAEIAAQLIREKFATQIRAAVSQIIEQKVTDTLIVEITDSAVNRMIHADEHY